MINKTTCTYKPHCKGFMPDYCNDRDLDYCLMYQEYQAKELETERQRVLELYPIYLSDIGQLRNVKNIEHQLRSQEPLTSKLEWEDYK